MVQQFKKPALQYKGHQLDPWLQSATGDETEPESPQAATTEVTTTEATTEELVLLNKRPLRQEPRTQLEGSPRLRQPEKALVQQ